jgi:hypothetical protein
MKEISSTYVNGKEILIVDFSGSKGSKMIRILNSAKKLIRHATKPLLLLEVFNDKSQMTPEFVGRFERQKWESICSIEKSAVAGLNDRQAMMFTGYYIFSALNIKISRSREAAMNYLVKDPSQQGLVPRMRRPFKS